MTHKTGWLLVVFSIFSVLLTAQTSGGPDAFGYNWVNSSDPNGPDFNWVDISTLGTAITLGDDGSQQVSLPWPFDFYDNTYTSVLIASNGYLTFGTTGGAYDNASIPANAQPNAVIAGFWDDLNPEQGGSIRYYNDSANDRFIVFFDQIQHYTTSGVGTYTFQYIFESDGDVVLQYQTLTGIVNSCTVGIENAAGTDGLLVLYNGSATLTNSLAIRFSRPTLAQFDLAAEQLSGPTFPILGQPAAYTAHVVNLGSDPALVFTVYLTDQNGAVLASAAGADLLSDETADIDLSWTPADHIPTTICARVELEDDEIPSDDVSPALTLYIQDPGVQVIGESELTTYHYPLDFYYRSSITETVYPAAILPDAGVALDRIAWHSDFDLPVAGANIQVWVGEASASDLATNWIPASDLTLAYEGAMSFPAGSRPVIVNLAQPYLYNGGDLVVMVRHGWSEQASDAHKVFHYAAEIDGAATRFCQDDQTEITPDQLPPGTYENSCPTTLLRFHDPNTTAHLHGLVTDTRGEPVAGAEIFCTSVEALSFTAQDGTYDCGFLPFGAYQLTVTAPNYQPADLALELNAETDSTNIVMNWDLCLAVIPTTNSGMDPAGAIVTLANADTTYTATVDEYGSAVIHCIVPGVYDMTVAKATYSTYHIPTLQMVDYQNQQWFIELIENVLAPSNLAYYPRSLLAWQGGSGNHAVRNDAARELIAYHVVLDGQYLGSTTNTYYTVPDLTDGSNHTAGVSAEYVTAVSDTAWVDFVYSPTGDVAKLPLKTALKGVSPNPFNPETTVVFDVAHGETAALGVYDLRGRQVRNLGEYREGTHRVLWNGFDDHGQRASSGVYIMRMMAGGKAFVQKTLLLK
jgi:hypothetical protein